MISALGSKFSTPRFNNEVEDLLCTIQSFQSGKVDVKTCTFPSILEKSYSRRLLPNIDKRHLQVKRNAITQQGMRVKFPKLKRTGLTSFGKDGNTHKGKNNKKLKIIRSTKHQVEHDIHELCNDENKYRKMISNIEKYEREKNINQNKREKRRKMRFYLGRNKRNLKNYREKRAKSACSYLLKSRHRFFKVCEKFKENNKRKMFKLRNYKREMEERKEKVNYRRRKVHLFKVNVIRKKKWHFIAMFISRLRVLEKEMLRKRHERRMQEICRNVNYIKTRCVMPFVISKRRKKVQKKWKVFKKFWKASFHFVFKIKRERSVILIKTFMTDFRKASSFHRIYTSFVTKVKKIQSLIRQYINMKASRTMLVLLAYKIEQSKFLVSNESFDVLMMPKKVKKRTIQFVMGTVKKKRYKALKNVDLDNVNLNTIGLTRSMSFMKEKRVMERKKSFTNLREVNKDEEVYSKYHFFLPTHKIIFKIVSVELLKTFRFHLEKCLEYFNFLLNSKEIGFMVESEPSIPPIPDNEEIQALVHKGITQTKNIEKMKNSKLASHVMTRLNLQNEMKSYIKDVKELDVVLKLYFGNDFMKRYKFLFQNADYEMRKVQKRRNINK